MFSAFFSPFQLGAVIFRPCWVQFNILSQSSKTFQYKNLPSKYSRTEQLSLDDDIAVTLTPEVAVLWDELATTQKIESSLQLDGKECSP
eukprot:m.241527 g.241527  ORF g.241527 m.241527 type:complete len:89 (-) comp16088_c0_seq19:1041-1307(-)